MTTQGVISRLSPRESCAYAPPPADVAKDTGVIGISRTWRLTTSDGIEIN